MSLTEKITCHMKLYRGLMFAVTACYLWTPDQQGGAVCLLIEF